MKKSEKSLNAAQIEAQIEAELAKSGEVVLAVLLEKLALKPDDETGRARVENFLSSDGRLFSADGGKFILRSAFFNGKTFVITPDDDEIEQNILYPGHRFMPFMSSDVFPSEVQILPENRKTPLKFKTLKCNLETIFHYHILMGSEQLSDFLIAENEEIGSLAEVASKKHDLSLNVLDMEKFYAAHEFSGGDALAVKILDFETGKFEISYLDGTKRKDAAVNHWIELYEQSVAKVIEKHGTYLDLPEQLSLSFLTSPAEIFGKNSASLDEFIRRTEKFDIGFDDEHTCMVKKSTGFENTDGEAPIIPDGLGISGGKTDSLASILLEIGSAVTPEEIDSYILDCCYNYENDFETFLNFVFNLDKLKFADEAQKMVFLNYLEERFEFFHENYDRSTDENKAALRGRILESVNLRNEFLDYLSSLEIAEDTLKLDEMAKIAEGMLHFDRILNFLNNGAQELAAEEAEEMGDSLESVETILEESIDKIKSNLNI